MSGSANGRLAVRPCQRRLAVIWFAGAMLVFLIVLLQTLLHPDVRAQAEKAWSWFVPTFVPTLSLIVSAVAYDARRPREEEPTVDSFAYHMTWWLSLFYVLVVVATLLLRPLSAMPPLRLMEVSQLWIGPVQGLVGIALGIFFVSRGK